MVLAIGGGSVIDCAKVVAAGACYDGDPWDLVITPRWIKKALPIYSVLTLSATGSEMDKFAVISDMSKNEKWGTASDHMKPKMSILDPEYTYSVSKKQTAAGNSRYHQSYLRELLYQCEECRCSSKICGRTVKELF